MSASTAVNPLYGAVSIHRDAGKGKTPPKWMCLNLYLNASYFLLTQWI